LERSIDRARRDPGRKFKTGFGVKFKPLVTPRNLAMRPPGTLVRCLSGKWPVCSLIKGIGNQGRVIRKSVENPD
jgi:hypothetical protein